jgi:hypothetical protein
MSEFYFAAGEMTVKDKKVTANPDRGVLRFYLNKETTLLSLKWENLAKKTSNDEIVITPGDYTFKKVSTKKGSPFFIQNVTYPDDKYFFYFQTNKKDDIEKYEKKIIEILEKGAIPQDEEEKSKPVPMSIEEVEKSKGPDAQQTQPQPQPQNQGNANFMQSFANILKKMQKKYPSLGKILTREKITKLFDSLDEESKKKLIELLPENQRTKQGFYDNINSPQFKQGLGSLTYALESENLPAIISSFGLDQSVAAKCEDGVEAFVKCIIAKYASKEDKKDDKKEDKKENK